MVDNLSIYPDKAVWYTKFSPLVANKAKVSLHKKNKSKPSCNRLELFDSSNVELHARMYREGSGNTQR